MIQRPNIRNQILALTWCLAALAVTPSYGQEFRFLWLSEPPARDSDPIPAGSVRDAKFNGVVVPALWEGTAWYPSKLLSKNEQSTDWNLLADEYRRAGLSIGVYLQVFIHGGEATHETHLARRYPEWLSRFRNEVGSDGGAAFSQEERSRMDGVFLDPGVPRVHEFLLGVVSEVLEVFKPDWLILDQVRYPILEPGWIEVGRWEQPFGFHPLTRSRFESEWGIDPAVFAGNPRQSAESLGEARTLALLQGWDEWRRSLVESFVVEVRNLIKGSFPSCRLAAIGYPDPFFAKRVALQDWPKWLQNELVDSVILPDNRLNGETARGVGILSPSLVDRVWISAPLEDELDRPSVLSEELRRLSFGNGVVLLDSSALELPETSEILASSWFVNEGKDVSVANPEGVVSETLERSPVQAEEPLAGDIRALYGFNPDAPPFVGLTPNQTVEKLEQMGINAVFGGSSQAPMRRALDVAGFKRFEEVPLFVGSEHWKRHPESQPVAANGKALKKSQWYAPTCPNQSWLWSEKIERIVSRVSTRDLDGIWLDFIRYPVFWEEVPPFLPETCFCPVCLSLFAEDTGFTPAGNGTAERAKWILDTHPEEWYRWRANRILEFVDLAVSEVKKISPDTIVGAFVLPWQPEEHDGALYKVAGQDLQGFAERVDVLSPMLYFHQLKKSPSWVPERILSMSRNLGCSVLPILQCYDEPSPIPPENLEQALIGALQPPSDGVILFSQKHLENTHRWETVSDLLSTSTR